MPNAEVAQRRLVIRLIRVFSPSPVNRMNARSRRPSRVGAVPGRQPDRGRVDLLHVGRHLERRGRAGHHRRRARTCARVAEPAAGAARSGSAMIRRTWPSAASRASVAVGPQQHRDRAEPAERGDQRQRARPRAHQHADVLALAHADRDQPANDVVDPLVDLAGGVGAVLEQEEQFVGVACGCAPATSSPSEIAGARAESGPSGRAAAAGWRPRAPARGRCGPSATVLAASERTASDADLAGELESRSRPGCATVGLELGPTDRRGAGAIAARALAGAVAPARPAGDRRPGDRRWTSSRRRARSGRRGAPARRLGPRRRLADRADAGRRARSRRRCRRPTGSARSMSASVSSRSSITNPPSSIRLCAMNWRRKSAIAGPGHATQPSASRNRRWPSRGSSASRSCSCEMNSIRLRADLTGSSS